MKYFQNLTDLHKESGWPAPKIPEFSIIESGTCEASEDHVSVNAFVIRYKKANTTSRALLAFHSPGENLLLGGQETLAGYKLVFIHQDFISDQAVKAHIHKAGLFATIYADRFERLSAGDDKTFDSCLKILEFEFTSAIDEFCREILMGHVTAMLLYACRFTGK